MPKVSFYYQELKSLSNNIAVHKRTYGGRILKIKNLLFVF